MKPLRSLSLGISLGLLVCHSGLHAEGEVQNKSESATSLDVNSMDDGADSSANSSTEVQVNVPAEAPRQAEPVPVLVDADQISISEVKARLDRGISALSDLDVKVQERIRHVMNQYVIENKTEIKEDLKPQAVNADNTPAVISEQPGVKILKDKPKVESAPLKRVSKQNVSVSKPADLGTKASVAKPAALRTSKPIAVKAKMSEEALRQRISEINNQLSNPKLGWNEFEKLLDERKSLEAQLADNSGGQDKKAQN